MRRRKARRFADIDVTPLIDVLFMLIIFFVLTTTFAQGKLDIELPDSKAAPAGADRAVTVTVERGGVIYWAGRKVSKEELSSLARTAVQRDVVVAGDKSASYGDVAEVLAILRGAGIKSAGLLTQGVK